MTTDELSQLYRLLDTWIYEPDWDTGSDAWATLVEAKRQVLVELHELGHAEVAKRLGQE